MIFVVFVVLLKTFSVFVKIESMDNIINSISEKIITETFDTLSNLLRDLELENNYILDTHNTSMSKVLLERISNEVEDTLCKLRTLEVMSTFLER